MIGREDADQSYQWSLSTSPLAAFVTYDDYTSGLQRRSRVLTEFRQYTTPNWDGEGAEAISLAAIEQALELLGNLPAHVPAPEAAPGADGTIGLDWENERGTVCIDISGRRTVHYFLELSRQPSSRDENLAELSVTFLDRLSRVLATMYPGPRIRLHAISGGKGRSDLRNLTNPQALIDRVA